MRQLTRAVESSLFGLASAGILLLLVVLCLNVGMRWAGQGSIRGTIELGEVTMAFVGVLGIAHAQEKDGHVSTDILVNRFSERWRSWTEFTWRSIVLIVVSWATYHLAQRAWASFNAGESHYGARWVLIWPARVAIALAFGVLVVTLAIQAIETRMEPAARDG